LPQIGARGVGHIVFLDHLGPASFPAGAGIDVRPHPHIGLATLTFLFEGSITHRDSLGMVQDIRPGEVNWMTAGRNVLATRRARDRVQLWWRGPGWRPADVAARDPKPAFDLARHEHLKATAPGAVGIYTQVHVALLAPPMVLALVAAPLTSPLGHLALALHVAFGAQVLSMLVGPRWRLALALETLRLLSLLALAIDGAWIGGFVWPESLRWTALGVALASLAALPLLLRRWNALSGSPTGDHAGATAA
jgi:hypothetical protein